MRLEIINKKALVQKPRSFCGPIRTSGSNQVVLFSNLGKKLGYQLPYESLTNIEKLKHHKQSPLKFNTLQALLIKIKA